MKKVKMFTLLSVMLLAFASCKKDSDSDSSKFSIVGKWNVDLFSETETASGEIIDSFEHKDYGTIEFKDDETGTFEKKGDFTWEYVSTSNMKMLTISLDGTFTIYNYKLSEATSKKVVGSYSTIVYGYKTEGKIELSK